MNKQFFKKYSSALFYGALALFVLYFHGPRLYHNFKNEDQLISVIQYEHLQNAAQTLSFPSEVNNTIVLFWASWCAPCKLEMNRLKNSVESKKIKADKIFALNPFEDKETELNFIQKEKYPFTFIRDENNTLANHLNIQQTPTVVYFEKTLIKKISSGISLIGVFQAESFLSP